MEEIWRDIIGFKGSYQVSNYGRVRSCDREIVRSTGNNYKIKGILRKLTVGPNGYLVVNLTSSTTKVVCLVHRLVADAFLPNPENKPCVDHVNTDKLDNRADNLKWVTHFENTHNPLTFERVVCAAVKNHKKGGCNKLSKKVFRFSLDKKLICEYKSTYEAALSVGVKRSNIQACIYGTQIICCNSLWALSSEYPRQTDKRERYLIKYRKRFNGNTR